MPNRTLLNICITIRYQCAGGGVRSTSVAASTWSFSSVSWSSSHHSSIFSLSLCQSSGLKWSGQPYFSMRMDLRFVYFESVSKHQRWTMMKESEIDSGRLPAMDSIIEYQPPMVSISQSPHFPGVFTASSIPGGPAASAISTSIHRHRFTARSKARDLESSYDKTPRSNSVWNLKPIVSSFGLRY